MSEYNLGRNLGRKLGSTTMRECLLRDIHNLEDQLDFAMSEMERRGRERDKARDMVHGLRKQRAIARKFGEQMERERNEAREVLERLTNHKLAL